jgi:hypothetical protein
MSWCDEYLTKYKRKQFMTASSKSSLGKQHAERMQERNRLPKLSN